MCALEVACSLLLAHVIGILFVLFHEYERAPLQPDGNHLVPQTGLRLISVVPSVAKISKAITLRDTVNLT